MATEMLSQHGIEPKWRAQMATNRLVTRVTRVTRWGDTGDKVARVRRVTRLSR